MPKIIRNFTLDRTLHSASTHSQDFTQQMMEKRSRAPVHTQCISISRGGDSSRAAAMTDVIKRMVPETRELWLTCYDVSSER